MAAPPVEIPGYQLHRALGEGGMATVFLATQISLDRKVAIKILRTENDDDPGRTERRFLREGRILAKITHRNVCGIYDIAKVGDVAYIAMEFLDGGTLVDRQRDGIAVGESIAIVVQVASALQEAHNQGIVHRDLKPANVMMRGGKVPVLTDFGIARELASHQTRITTENMIVGTPVYMSPEQVTGGEIDVRSDIYSLGIMFYELLVGKAPYLGDNPIQVCMQHLTSPVPVLPPELDEINPVLARMLAKKAEERFATMSEFTHALRDVFVKSTQLRAKAELSPNQPWTEQLRQMGFSFDTLRDGELNAKLRMQQAAFAANRDTEQTLEPQYDQHQRPPLASAGSVAAGAYSYRKAEPAKKPWLAIAAAALIAISVAGYFALRDSGGGKAGRYQLQGMATVFDEQLARDALFEPADDNAAQTVADMREISGKSSITKARVEKLLAAVNAKLDSYILAQKFDEAQAFYTLALNAELLSEKQAEAMQKRISDTRTLIANKALIDTQLATLAAALKQNATPTELFTELDELRKLLPKTDTRLVANERAIGAKQLGQYAIALQNDDLDGAQVILAALQDKLPNFPELARYQTELRERQAKLGVESRLARIKTLLANDPLKLDSITLAAAGIAALTLSNPSTELAQLKAALLTRTRLAAQSALDQQDVKSAQAIIAALGEFARDDALRPARTRILAALDAAQAEALSGAVVIDTVPYSKVLSITDAAGRAIAIPAPGVTPLRVKLVEGQYRLELSNALGENKSVQVSVARRAQTESPHLLYTSKSDEYLREAGY
jgi:serine/threonine-protein kinase PpkA